MKKLHISIFTVMILICANSLCWANVKQMKTYKKVFPELKPKCNYCHVDEKPKKDDGKHDINEYGAKLKEMMGDGPLTVEILKQAGRHDGVAVSDSTEDAVEQIKDAVEKIEKAVEELENKKDSKEE